MQSEIPKQYLKLGDRTVLEHTVEKFTRHKKISRIVVVISPDDPYWQTTTLAGNDQVSTASGGKERCDSVLNGLKALADYASEQDWVLVHDAARPCVSGK
ncbi:MAG: 2-C-methyl-D-erythritol 4-phosphate cytidylyltransferase, partial [Gammaproteobacteria bacterium]|nr:2-C-methyl-D-erythritol 4-phosphate cytidylyltransferase [Gammaproteobacteria bacterium]